MSVSGRGCGGGEQGRDAGNAAGPRWTRLGGRCLSVGLAAGEGNKDEMQGMQQAQGGPVLEVGVCQWAWLRGRGTRMRCRGCSRP